MKQFLKPSLAKIIITVILFGVSFFFSRGFLHFPLEATYIPSFFPDCSNFEGSICPPMLLAMQTNWLIFVFNLAINLVIYYLVSCTCVFLWTTKKKIFFIIIGVSLIILISWIVSLLFFPKTCGGIAGERCPKDYHCFMTDNFPDAQGKCFPDRFPFQPFFK
jgi:hypothetical protein